MNAKIGLLGGTFDPPHQAHLIIAQEAMAVHDLDEVWFIPVRTPPHKIRDQLVSGRDRLEMTRRMISDNDRFDVSDIELKREGLSYTIDTVREFKKQFPSSYFYFIVGADMAEQLHTWKNFEALKTITTFIVSGRPGYNAENPVTKGILYINAPLFDISSTMIRERAAEQKTIRYLVPETVRTYIEERGLYE